MQSVSTLSLLNTSTALDAHDHPFIESLENERAETSVEIAFPPIRIGMSFDDREAPSNPLKPPLKGSSFRFRDTNFIAELTNYPTHRSIEVRVSTEERMEIAYTAQVRIRTGSGGIPATKVVDKDVFNFASQMPPLVVKVMDEKVVDIHFELRFINMIERAHPKFTEGDVILQFSDGPPLVTWKSLLAYHSSYMEEKLRNLPEGGVADVSPFPRQDFLTLLEFIYPTRIPIFKDFKGLVRAANAFKVKTVLYACSRHFVDHPDWTIERKIPEAIKINLLPATEELVYKAYRSGLWTKMVSAGMRPEDYCGVSVYRKIVCPVILKTRTMRFGQTLLPSPWKQPDFYTPPIPEDQWKYVKIVVMGTPFYVNRGILEIYGTEGFLPSEDRTELVASITQGFLTACKLAKTTPGEVVTVLLSWMHPFAPPIPSRLVLPAFLFAHHHKMHLAAEELEQQLITIPPGSAGQLLENLLLAERLRINNLLLVSLQRIEGSCHIFTSDLLQHPFFEKLSKQLKGQVVDRICSGWAIQNCPLMKRQATGRCIREVTLEKGGPQPEVGMAAETFQSLYSNVLFGAEIETHRAENRIQASLQCMPVLKEWNDGVLQSERELVATRS